MIGRFICEAFRLADIARLLHDQEFTEKEDMRMLHGELSKDHAGEGSAENPI
jgi:hypothetical protein